jgi:hypothetical protein
MKTTTGGRPPEWALLLVAQVCAEHGRRAPTVQWWTREGRWSSGHQYPGRKLIHVTAGTDLLDQQGVLLHELCHHLCPPKWHHNKRFYERLFVLYAKWLPDDLPALAEREGQYMKRSLEVAAAYLPAS